MAAQTPPLMQATERIVVGTMTKATTVAGALANLGGLVTLRAGTKHRVVRGETDHPNDDTTAASQLILRITAGAEIARINGRGAGSIIVQNPDGVDSEIDVGDNDITVETDVAGASGASGQLSIAGRFILRQVC